MDLALQSPARQIFLILDCCHSGALANSATMNKSGQNPLVVLRENITVIAACRATEVSLAKEAPRISWTTQFAGAYRSSTSIQSRTRSAASIPRHRSSTGTRGDGIDLSAMAGDGGDGHRCLVYGIDKRVAP